MVLRCRIWMFSAWIDVGIELIAVGASPVIASESADVRERIIV